MFPESLRWRIQLWHGFLLAAALTGFAFATHQYQASNELRRVDGELHSRIRMLADAMRDRAVRAVRRRPLSPTLAGRGNSACQRNARPCFSRPTPRAPTT